MHSLSLCFDTHTCDNTSALVLFKTCTCGLCKYDVVKILYVPCIFYATIVGYYKKRSKIKTMHYKLGAVLVVFCLVKSDFEKIKKVKCNINYRNYTLKLIFLKQYFTSNFVTT